MSTTPELAEALVTVSSAGGRMRVVDGRLRVDVDVELPETVWQLLKDHREELIAELVGDGDIWTDDGTPIWSDGPAGRRPLPAPAGADSCDRCGAVETVDQEIHDGQSVRRDCAACGRFRAFTRWRTAG